MKEEFSVNSAVMGRVAVTKLIKCDGENISIFICGGRGGFGQLYKTHKSLCRFLEFNGRY